MTEVHKRINSTRALNEHSAKSKWDLSPFNDKTSLSTWTLSAIFQVVMTSPL